MSNDPKLPWRTGLIPCAGWYFIEDFADYDPVWLEPWIDRAGYGVTWSLSQEAESIALLEHGVDPATMRWRSDLKQVTKEQGLFESMLLRTVPEPGAWGVLGHTMIDGEPVPDGCRPIDWRATRELAEWLARDMGNHWVAEVVNVDGGWSIGEAHWVEGKFEADRRRRTEDAISTPEPLSPVHPLVVGGRGVSFGDDPPEAVTTFTVREGEDPQLLVSSRDGEIVMQHATDSWTAAQWGMVLVDVARNLARTGTHGDPVAFLDELRASFDSEWDHATDQPADDPERASDGPMIGEVKPEPRPDVVRVLEALVVRARAGEVLSLAAAFELTGREIATTVGGDVAPFALVGALEFVKKKILSDYVEGSR